MIDDALKEALELLDMEYVLDREGVSYKVTHGHSGVQLNIRECPRCGNKDWKVYLNAEKGLGNCFSGGCSGEPGFNKWSFISNLFEQTGRPLATLIESLAKEQGWRPKRKRNDVMQVPSEWELPACVAVASMPDVPEYLARRGITRELAAYFDLRLSTNGIFQLGTIRQDYSNRVIIPIADLDGQLKTFQGRDTTDTAEDRYLFPPRLAGSGAYLYNGQNFQPGMTTAIISEGVFDVIAVKRAIDSDHELRDWLPLGTFGMHLSANSPGDGNDQTGRLQQLRSRGVKRVVFLWDGELEATKRALDAGWELRRRGWGVSVAMLPAGLDPDEAGAQAVLQALKTARPLNTVSDRLRILQQAKKAGYE